MYSLKPERKVNFFPFLGIIITVSAENGLKPKKIYAASEKGHFICLPNCISPTTKGAIARKCCCSLIWTIREYHMKT